MISSDVVMHLAYVILQLGIIAVTGQNSHTQFLHLQPTGMRSNRVGARTNPSNLTGRSYDAAGRVPASISTDYRRSLISDPFMHYPNTDNMYFRLPAAPTPPDPPGLGYSGGGNGMNYQPFLNMWNNYPGVGSAYSSTSNGGGGYGGNTANTYYPGGGGSNNANGVGGYGSSGGGYSNNNGPLSGNGAINYGASGVSSNGYRPSSQQQQTGLGNNAYGGSGGGQQASSSGTGSNVQNGYIVSSGSAGTAINNNQAGGGNYGNSNNVNQYGAGASNPGSGYGTNGGYGGGSGSPSSGTRTCRPDNFPNNQGVCTLRNQLKRKCKNTMNAFSSDCSGKELCCFDPSMTIPPTTSTTPVPVTTVTAPTTSAPVTSSATTSGTVIVTTTSSSGGGSTTATNGGGSTTTAGGGSVTTTGNGGVSATTAGGGGAATTAGGGGATTTASNGGGVTTTMASGGTTAASDRYCIPDAHPSVVNGICRSNMDVPSKCSGIFASTSANCYPDEMCCYDLVAVTTTTPVTVPVTTTIAPGTVPTTSTSLATSMGPVTMSTNPATIPRTPAPARCSPGSYAAITNGLCVPANQIAQSCKGKQISPSLDCGNYEYCCFVADSATGGGFYQPGVSCSPDNNPMIGNGRCVAPSQIATQCPGMLLSNSMNCQSNQLCCYTTISTSAPVITTASTTPSTVSPTALTTPVTVTTTPVLTTSPTTTAAPVLTTTTITAATTQMTAAPTSIPTQGPAGPTCRPGRYPYALPNGTCVSQSQLAFQCKGLQLDYSLDCDYYQYCCYSHGSATVPYSAPVTIAPGSCTPDASPTIDNGFCVDGDNLMAQCSAIQASTSPNCGVTQFCCYTQGGGGGTTTPTAMTTVTGANTTPVMTTASSSSTGVTAMTTLTTATASSSPTVILTTIGATTSTTSATGNTPCTPDSVPSTTGICVNGALVATVCSQKEMSTSNQCASGQFCCYNAITGTTPQPTANTTGSPVSTAPTVTSTTPSVTSTSGPGMTTANGGGTSSSYTSTTGTSRTGCSPQGHPEIQNGVCTSLFSLATQCDGLLALPSTSCGTYEYCCFGSQTSLGGALISGSAFSQSSSGNGEAIFQTITKEHGLPNGSVSAESNGQAGHPAAGQQLVQISGNSQTQLPPSSGHVGSLPVPASNGQPSLPSFVQQQQQSSGQAGNQPIQASNGQTNLPSFVQQQQQSSGQAGSQTISDSVRQPGFGQQQQQSSGQTGGQSNVQPGSPAFGQQLVQTSGDSQSRPSSGQAGGQSIPVSNGQPGLLSVGQQTAQISGGSQTQPQPSSGQTGSQPIPVSNGQLGGLSFGQQNAQSNGGLQSQSSGQTGSQPIPASNGQPGLLSVGQQNAQVNGDSQIQLQPLSGQAGGQSIPASNSQPGPLSVGQQKVQFSGGSQTQLQPSSGQAGSQPIPASNGQPGFPSFGQQTPQVSGGSQVLQQSSGQADSQASPASNGQPGLLSFGQQKAQITGDLQTPQQQSFGQAGNQPIPTSNGQPGLLSFGQQKGQINGNSQIALHFSSSDQAGSQSIQHCSPDQIPTATNGFCVSTGQLQAQCSGNDISESSQCAVDQYCCYTPPPLDDRLTIEQSYATTTGSSGLTTTTSAVTVPVTTTSVTIASTTAATTTTSAALTTTTSPLVVRTTSVTSPSSTISSSTSSGQTGSTCSPVSSPGSSSGLCMDLSQLASQCQGGRVASSSQCLPYQYCCFGMPSSTPTVPTTSASSSSTPTTVLSQSTTTAVQTMPSTTPGSPTLTTTTSAGGPCSPVSDPTVSNGICVEVSQLSTLCQGMRASKAAQCSSYQYCCFTGTSTTLTTSGLPTTTAGQSTAASTTVSSVATTTTAKPTSAASSTTTSSTSTSVSSSSPSNVQCTPVTDPDVTDGMCTDVSQLSTLCQGMRAARATQCSPYQYCCFGNISSMKVMASTGMPQTTSTTVTQAPPTTVTQAPPTTITSTTGSTATTAEHVKAGEAIAQSSGSSRHMCIPTSSPSVRNGLCTSLSDLGTLCNSQRISKSKNCQPSDFCCFSSSSPSSIRGEATTAGKCTPSSAPTVHNGTCVAMSNLQSQCQGLRMSKSSDCPSSPSFMCCFQSATSGGGGNNRGGPGNGGNNSGGPGNGGNNGGGPGNGGNNGGGPGNGGNNGGGPGNGGNNGGGPGNGGNNGGGPGNGGNNGGGTGGGSACSPNTAPSVTNGLCTDVSQLSSSCRGMTFSKSKGCAKNQFCCFSTSSRSGGPPTCTPKTQPSVTNGQCVPTNQLGSKCRGQTFSKSDHCASGKFCCFAPHTGSPHPCTPATQPSVTNGFCAATSQLSSQCKGMTFSKSNHCGSSHFCCFNATHLKSSPPPSASCSPSTAPQVTNGICTNTDVMTVQCKGQRIATSSDCASGQHCCFTETLKSGTALGSTVSGGCSPQTQPGVTNGKCVSQDHLTAECGSLRFSRSPGCQFNQYCCFSDANSLSGGASIVALRPGSTTSSGSPDNGGSVGGGGSASGTVSVDDTGTHGGPGSGTISVGGDVMASGGSGGQAGSGSGDNIACTPKLAPSATNGICVEFSQLGSQCAGRQVSKAATCSNSQFCCFSFDDTNAGGGIKSAGDNSCTPNSDPTIKNGVCSHISQMSTLCAGRQLSKSGNCGSDQFCCFSAGDTPNVISTGGSTDTVTPNGGTCTPISQPSVNNGICIVTSQLNVQCNNQRISKSGNCGENQFCCFSPNASSSGSGASSVSLTGTIGGTGSGLASVVDAGMASQLLFGSGGSTTCSPNMALSVTNGVCVAGSQLGSRCAGRQISKSTACSNGQFCCYNADDNSVDGSTKSVADGSCSPNSDPTIKNGVCTDMNQMSSLCAGRQLSKSGNCATDQFCCFSTDGISGGGFASGSKDSGTPSGGTCTPNSEPSVTNGVCVETGQLTTQCTGQRLSKSANCGAHHYCCFSASTSASGGTNGGTNVVSGTGTRGSTNSVIDTGVASQSLSGSDGSPACSPNSAPSITNGVCVANSQLNSKCSGRQISKSGNCATDQFCCFLAGEISATSSKDTGTPSGGTCTPNSQPSVNNGVCVETSQLSAQCSTQRFSESANCGANHFCCFSVSTGISVGGGTSGGKESVSGTGTRGGAGSGTNSVITPTGMANQLLSGSSGSTACSPNLAPSITNGVCVDGNQLGSSCAGRQISKSAACSNSQFCCYNADDNNADGGTKFVADGFCSPNSDPTIENGVCADISQMGSLCAGRQLSKSGNCRTDQFCCFSGVSPINDLASGSKVTVTTSAATCTPNSDPSVNDGVCVESSQLSVQCNNQRLSKSTNCAASQFCCFAAKPSSVSGTGTRGGTSTVAGGSGSEPVPGSSGNSACTPNSDPVIKSGVCTDMSQMSSLCAGRQLSKSFNCAPDQFCCFSGDSPSSGFVSGSKNTGAPSDGTCTPNSEPSVNNGVCVDTDQLRVQCNNQRLSKSTNCGENQFCCFTASTSSSGGAGSGPSGVMCTPRTEPTVTNGTCVDGNQITTQCSAKRLSKSNDCASGQFCCFTSNPSAGMGTVKIASNLVGSATGSCTPVTEPTITNGTCVNESQVGTQCSSQRLSKSNNCASNQFCCFTSSAIDGTGSVTNAGNKGGAGSCTPTSDPTITDGTCVDESQLATQCSSQRLSKSSNCASNQFCCFSSNTNSGSRAGSSGACMPRTEPTVTNGTCVDESQLVKQCASQRLSKSNNCGSNQFCCFTASVASESASGSRGGVAGSGLCVPSTELSITNGTCVDSSQLSSQCPSQRLSKSNNCASNQFCCFSTTANRGSVGSSGGICTPNTEPTIANGMCVESSQVANQCSGQRMAKSNNCADDQFCCFPWNGLGNKTISGAEGSSSGSCTPRTVPSITNGVCVDNNQITSQCSTKRLSKSGDCADNQFCCFTANTGGGGGSGGTGGSCTPKTEPSITNGVCVAENQIKDQCEGQRLSKSSDCATSQFCCFSGNTTSSKAAVSLGCTPKTEPSITNGVCVAENQIKDQCEGQRLSKSSDCASNQFCCFRANTGGGGGSGGGSCTPKTEPSITNGVCVDENQIQDQCAGQRLSKSSDCASSEFCCFTGNVSGTSNNKAAISGGCTPLSNPSVSNGVCLDVSALASQCLGKQLAKSNDCQSAQYCCFSNSPVTTYPPPPAAMSCIPKTEPSISNGTCVDINQLSSQCQNLRFSKSANCQSTQFCCFGLPPVVSPQNLCTPETEPTVTNGACLVSGDLPVRCNAPTSRAAKSINCQTSQWCCFNSPVSQAFGQPAPLLTGAALSGSDTNGFKNITVPSDDSGLKVHSPDDSSQRCSPNSDPSIKNGICLSGRDLQAKCAEKRASPSVDCPRFSWCCFENPATIQSTTEAVALVNPIRIDIFIPDVALTKTCTPNSEPSINNGRCSASINLSAACAGQELSRSPDCDSGQFCCFNRSIPATQLKVAPPTLTACTPNADSSVHNGQCMRMRQLSEQCVDRKASPSADCAMGEWCCFGESSSAVVALTSLDDFTTSTEAPSTTEAAAVGQCAPNNNPTLRNGICQTIRQLQVSCIDKQAAPSPDCEMGRWCCYTEPSTGNSNKNVDEGLLLTTTATDVVSTIVAVSVDGTCTPNAEPSVENGTCMPTRDLRLRCRNRRVSKSPQCRMGQWCCFTDPLEASSTAGDFSPIGRSVMDMGAL